MRGELTRPWMYPAVLLAALLLAACLGGGRRTVRVYVSLPLKGPSPNTTSMGKSIRRGIELAFEEVSNQVGNIQIDPQVRVDGNEIDQWQPDTEARVAHEAASDNSAVAYIGPYNSGAAKVSIPILNRAGMSRNSLGTT